MHVSEQDVVLGDTPMKKAFAEGFPQGRDDFPRQDAVAYDATLFLVKSAYPAAVFDDRDDEQGYYADAEGNDKRTEHVICDL